MLAKLLRRPTDASPDLISSRLYDEYILYKVFLKDLSNCQSEAIIESPFITTRLSELLPTLKKLKERKVRAVIVMKDSREHGKDYSREDATDAISKLQSADVHVIFTYGHHRKLAILDHSLPYEGSLNILAQNNSQEIMRRIELVQLPWQTVRFINVDKLL